MAIHRLAIEKSQQPLNKEQVKNWIAKMVVAARPQRAVDLYRSPAENSNSFADKAILFHLRQRAIEQERHGFLSRLHEVFWSGEEGACFSENCDHRFEELFLSKQQVDFDQLKTNWDSGDFQSIVELGTNSGLLLQYMTENLADVRQSVGIDINATQIERNQHSDKFDPRIEFLCTDGRQWITKNAQPATLFVTNGGVLEYFRREKLDEMMSHISSQCQPAVFFASEPVADDHNFETTSQSIPFGEELSFSHNYRDLFESNGFKVVHQRDVVFESWKMQATIAVTDPTQA